MATSWATREDCLDALGSKGNVIQAQRIAASAALNVVNGSFTGVDDPVAKLCWQYMVTYGQAMIMALRSLIDYKYDHDPTTIIPYFLTHYTTEDGGEPPEPEPLTWKDIVKAWSAATLPGMMWSVTMIDLMRRECWNEPENTKWQESPFE